MCHLHFLCVKSLFVSLRGRLQALPPFPFNFKVGLELADFLLSRQQGFLHRREAAQSCFLFHVTLDISAAKKSKTIVYISKYTVYILPQVLINLHPNVLKMTRYDPSIKLNTLDLINIFTTAVQVCDGVSI